MSKRSLTKGGRGWGGPFLGLILLSATACQELQVENLVEPDRERATANPGDVEAFIGGAFHPPMWEALHRTIQTVTLWPQAGPEFTATYSPAGDTELRFEDVLEPRRPHNNFATISLGNGPHGPRNTWANVTRANSIAFDGLQILNDGLIICDPVSNLKPCPEGSVDMTPRARAFAKFMQGWTWGWSSTTPTSCPRIWTFPPTATLPPSRRSP
jgi:hypothetical protein